MENESKDERGVTRIEKPLSPGEILAQVDNSLSRERFSDEQAGKAEAHLKDNMRAIYEMSRGGAGISRDKKLEDEFKKNFNRLAGAISLIKALGDEDAASSLKLIADHLNYQGWSDYYDTRADK